MASIIELIKNIRNARLGKDVRESIASAIEQTYEDATEKGSSNMEVAQARGGFNTLRERLNNSDTVKASKQEVATADNNLQNQINSLASGSPAGAYATVETLTTADPDHSKIYVVNSDGHWYYYDGNEWKDGGPYLATEIAVSSVGTQELNSEIKDFLNMTIEVPEISIIHGKYMGADHSYADNNYAMTSVIELPVGAYIRFKTNGIYSQVKVLVETTPDGTVTKNVIFEGDNQGAKTYYHQNVTNGTKFIRISYNKSIGLNDLLIYKNKRYEISDNEIIIPQLSNKLKDVLDISSRRPIITNTYGSYIRNNKQIGNDIDFAHTNVISLNPNEILTFKTNSIYSQASVLAETNSDMSEVINVIYTGDTDGAKEYNYKNESENIRYFVISYNVQIGLSDVYIYTEVNGKSITRIVNNEGITPLEFIIKDGGFLGCFDKISCIGDSLTFGGFESNVGGNDYVPNLSTPAQMQKIIGNTVINLGISGYCASRSDLSMSWYDEAISRGWFGDNYKGQCYIIALGVNDTWRQNGFIGNVNTDIDVNNPSNNAMNSVGGYATIIQKIKEIQPRARIFCVTIPNMFGKNNTLKVEANEKIRAIAELFECYIIDLEKYYIPMNEVNDFANKYIVGSHLNALGYKEIANVVITYIDWIIRNNISDFKDIQFIGTDRYYE